MAIFACYWRSIRGLLSSVTQLNANPPRFVFGPEVSDKKVAFFGDRQLSFGILQESDKTLVLSCDVKIGSLILTSRVHPTQTQR